MTDAVVAGGGAVRAQHRRRRQPHAFVSALTAILGSVGFFTLPPALATAADSCPNAQFRTGYSASLPDCRAYEMVSPLEKNGGEVGTSDPYVTVQDWQSSTNGNKMLYWSLSPFANAQAGSLIQSYLASRGASDWSTDALLPPQAPANFFNEPDFVAYSTDLSKAILVDGGGNGQDQPLLVSGEPQGVSNLFVRDNAAGSYQLVSLNPVSGSPADAQFDGASSDLSHVVFDENAQLTSDAPSGDDLYEWIAGTVSLVTLVPVTGTSCTGTGCTPAVGSLAGNPFGGATLHAVSADGSRIIFAGPGGLYVREDGTTTVQADAVQPGAPGPGGGSQVMTASTDGSEVFFADDASAGLTTDTVAGSGQNLYRYDTATDTLTDLTPADVSGISQVDGVLGASADGSYVYFVANGALAPGASSGNCPYSAYPDPTATCNLYVSHNGTTTFIATLDGNDSNDWTGYANANGQTPGGVRVTPDGAQLAFESVRSLTGYDNTVAQGSSCGTDVNGSPTGDPHCSEVFLYDASSNRLTCVSCNPTGAPPLGPSTIGPDERLGGSSNALTYPYTRRNLSDDGGRLFFNSYDALLPEVANGMESVYEFEQDGAGSCTHPNGCLYLVSSGASSSDSTFEDASSNGSDVFFVTRQQLVPADTDLYQDVYNARLDGGLASQNQEPATPCSSSDVCQGSPSSPPSSPLAATITFFGPGNTTASAAAGKVKVLRRVVHGSTFFLRVQVPGVGQVVISGAGIRTVRRSIARAGAYRLRVTLTPKARSALRRKRKLELRLRVAYAPAGGTTSTATVSLTVEPAARHFHKRTKTARRATSRKFGGAR